MNAKTFNRQTAKFLAVVGESMPELSSDEMQRWIQDPRALQRFLNGLRTSTSEFKVWKTIKLGTGPKTAEDFQSSIKAIGNKISKWASDILSKRAFTTSDTEMELDLVNVSARELGFEKGATRKEIYERALILGLQLCPAEVGPQLRLQYQDQPNGEWLTIGMEPVSGSGDDLYVFRVVRGDDDLWLYSNNDRPESFWNPVGRWVFVRPRK